MTAFPEWMDKAVAALEMQGSKAVREAWEAVRPWVARVHATPVDPFTEPAPVPVMRRSGAEEEEAHGAPRGGSGGVEGGEERHG
ncbi:MAG: hypothetical protein HY660_06675 [Armatimonadetes bacterium]|nr:hypothetical protein [Armatimonadota bacterium]